MTTPTNTPPPGMGSARHYMLATAGHVDHGKTALIRALTGIDCDRLPEERKRGITIDLGFAHLDLRAPNGAAEAAGGATPVDAANPEADGTDPTMSGAGWLRVGVVDVPGHEDFVKNMVAGVGAVDAALLALAADDGWMPQTAEHLRILDYLGVTRLVVALTKADLLPSARARADALAAARGHLDAAGFADAPIVPTSVRAEGAGLGALRAALARLLAGAPPAADVGKPRLPIDRVFTLRGVGTVVTGTLIGGALGRGQQVVVRPGNGGGPVRVRAVQCHRRDVESAPPGSRVALNLPDLPTDPADSGAPRRGDVVTLESIGDPTLAFDAWVFQRADSTGAARVPTAAASAPLRGGAAVVLHLGSGHHAARLHLPAGMAALPPGGGALARVRLDAPALVFAGDRFVVRDASARATLAGGIVLDPDAPSRRGGRRAATAQRRFLEERAAAPGDVRVFVRSALARDLVVRRETLLRRSRFGAGEIAAALEGLGTAGEAFLTGTLAAEGAWWRALREAASAVIDARHRAHPEQTGLPLTVLRAALAGFLAGSAGPAEGARPIDPAKGSVVAGPVVSAGEARSAGAVGSGRAAARVAGVFEMLVADLAAGREFALAGASIRRAGHRPELPARLLAAGARVRAALLAKPLEPPSRAIIAPDAAAQAALRFLIEIGEVVELGAGTVVASGSFARMRVGVVRHLRAHGAATASDLRQALGTTRRILVPLLERLDHDGITRRVGDQRVLREASRAATG